MRKSALFIASMALPFLSVVESADAQDFTPSCACSVEVTSGTAIVGRLSSVQGEVLIQGQTGFRPARSGTTLTFGGRLMTGAQGSVSVSAGPLCSLQLAPMTELNVLGAGTNACLQVTNLAPPSPAQPVEQTLIAEDDDDNNTLFFIGGGAVLVGAGVAAGLLLISD